MTENPHEPLGPEAPSFAPPVTPPAPPVAPPYPYAVSEPEPRRPGQPFAWSGAAIVVLLIVGAVGPWATLGPFSVGGLGNDDGAGDGIIVIGLAVLYGAAIGAYLWNRRLWKAILAVVFGVVAVAVGITDVVDVSQQEVDGIFGDGFSVGWGLWLSLVGGIAATALGAVLCVVSRR